MRYFEGQDNELAAFGYNRDGKRGKQQMVAGLLTDGAGEPLSIQLYAGNTSDPPTFLDAVEQLKVRFGDRGDRGGGRPGDDQGVGPGGTGRGQFPLRDRADRSRKCERS